MHSCSHKRWNTPNYHHFHQDQRTCSRDCQEFIINDQEILEHYYRRENTHSIGYPIQHIKLEDQVSVGLTLRQCYQQLIVPERQNDHNVNRPAFRQNTCSQIKSHPTHYQHNLPTVTSMVWQHADSKTSTFKIKPKLHWKANHTPNNRGKYIFNDRKLATKWAKRPYVTTIDKPCSQA